MSFYNVQQRTSSGLSDIGQFPAKIVGSMGSAIIESGSNANGNYVKFADGTLICWQRTSVNYYAQESIGTKAKKLNFALPANSVVPNKFSGSFLNISVPGIPVVTTNYVRNSSSTIYIYAQPLRDSDTLKDLADSSVEISYNFISTWK